MGALLTAVALLAGCDDAPVPPTGENPSAPAGTATAEAPGAEGENGVERESGATGPHEDESPDAQVLAGGSAEHAPQQPSTGLGEGFVVWESNRSGSWRIWIRPLAGGPPRQLTPDEPGRQHYAPHISPDGRSVAFLSTRDPGRKYTQGGVVGALRLIDPDGGAPRELVPAARTYFENRSVVWRSAAELIYIGGDRRTRLLDVTSGESELLTEEPGDRFGCLIDATLSHASSNSPTFSLFEPKSQRILPRSSLGGCQPYFSHDGRWGVWTAGAGGPIRKMDLDSRRTGKILDKNDPRLPDGLGYLYFPMPSRDGTLLALAGSRDEHDHFTSDYEIFVVETDPETLEVIGTAQRFTHDPSTDRFPDVYRRPLELGSHRGEAPFEIELTAPGGGAWRWTTQTGAVGAVEGPSFRHRYERAGAYTVEATRGGETLQARIVVAPPRPPEVADARLSGDGRQVIVEFDEPVRIDGARLAFASGREVAGRALDEEGRTLRLDLARPFDGTDRLELAGIEDRAVEPHTMPAASVEIGPLRWPAVEEGLVFAWQTADAANLVPVAGGTERAVALRAAGTARLDHYWAMLPGAGRFVADAEDAARVRSALQRTNETTIELTLRNPRGPKASLVEAADARRLNFRLERRGAKLIFQMRARSRGPGAHPAVELFDLPPGMHHVVVTYSPGRLVGYLDGEARLDVGAETIRGDFFHWRGVPLSFGEGDAGATSIEGVAIYDRVLDTEEVDAEYRRYRQQMAGRSTVPSVIVEGRLVARTPAPRLEQISPYREALAVSEYEVLRIESGEVGAKRIRVAHWAILDGERPGRHEPTRGDVLRLVLEPFDANPQLASLYLGQAGEIDSTLPLFYAPDPHPTAAAGGG